MSSISDTSLMGATRPDELYGAAASGVNEGGNANGGRVETAVYTRRWAILAIFSVTLFLNQAQYTAFVSIVNETRDFYNIGSLAVNMLAAVYSAMYVVSVFPVCLLYERMGFRTGNLLAGATNVASAVLKFISVWSPNYAWLIIGQAFGGVSQVLMLSLPPMLASLWFPIEERTLATAVGTLSGFLGIAFSFFFSPRILHAHPDKDHFFTLWVIHLASSAVVFGLSLVVVKESPPKPPSISARTAEREHFTFAMLWVLIKKQATNFSFMRLCIGFGMTNGFVTALATVLSQLFLPYDIDEDTTGNIVSIGLVCGCLNCAVVALLVDKYRIYKKPMLGLFGCLATLLAVCVVLMVYIPSQAYSYAYAILIPAEMLLLPVIPIAMEFAVEKTFPDPEMVGSSFAIVSLSLFAVVGGVVYSAILGDTPDRRTSETCMYLSIAIVVFSFLLTLTVREEHHRHAHEKRESTLNGPEGGAADAE